MYCGSVAQCNVLYVCMFRVLRSCATSTSRVPILCVSIYIYKCVLCINGTKCNVLPYMCVYVAHESHSILHVWIFCKHQYIYVSRVYVDTYLAHRRQNAYVKRQNAYVKKLNVQLKRYTQHLAILCVGISLCMYMYCISTYTQRVSILCVGISLCMYVLRIYEYLARLNSLCRYIFLHICTAYLRICSAMRKVLNCVCRALDLRANSISRVAIL